MGQWGSLTRCGYELSLVQCLARSTPLQMSASVKIVTAVLIVPTPPLPTPTLISDEFSGMRAQIGRIGSKRKVSERKSIKIQTCMLNTVSHPKITSQYLITDIKCIMY